MAVPSIIFNRGTSGLGRPIPGSDYISGAVFYVPNGSLPAGFSTSNNQQKFFSVADAEAAGILSSHQGETAATATITITAVGANGDTISASVLEYGGSVLLGSYTKVVGDTTVTAVATGLVAGINANTQTTGYSAVVGSSGALTITARPGLGVFLNSGTPLSTVIVGAITRTLTQFASGAYSILDYVHYHISEYFRIQPQGVLFVGLYPIPGTFAFTEVANLIDYAGGQIRQLCVYAPDTTLSSNLVIALDAVMMTKAGENKPASAVLCADFSASALSALPNLSNNTNYRTSIVIGQDGANLGYKLFKATGKTIGTAGATLGAVSLAAVNENIGWVAKFNMTDGNELATVAFGNGVLYSAQVLSLFNTLNSYKYIFLKYFINRAGTFHQDSNTAISNTNNFAYIEDVRTVDKAVRGIGTTTLDKLLSPINLNPDGTLAEDDISDFERLANITLDQMSRDKEISASKILINPTQPVLSTSTVNITVEVVPTGTNRNTVFNIGLTTSV